MDINLYGLVSSSETPIFSGKNDGGSSGFARIDDAVVEISSVPYITMIWYDMIWYEYMYNIYMYIHIIHIYIYFLWNPWLIVTKVPGMWYFIYMFRVRLRKITEKLIAARKPKKVIICYMAGL